MNRPRGFKIYGPESLAIKCLLKVSPSDPSFTEADLHFKIEGPGSIFTAP